MIIDARSIYWVLFWNVSIEKLNELVTLNMRQGNFERVKYYCKIIALKSMKIDLEEFWNREVLGKC